MLMTRQPLLGHDSTWFRLMAAAVILLWGGLSIEAKPSEPERSVPERPTEKRGARAASAFLPVGDLPGGRFQSEALGVSEDGQVVFGESSSERSSDGTEAFHWTKKEGMRPLGGAFPPPVRSQPRACTPDGRILVGHSISAGGMPIATIWNGTSTPRSLGDLAGGDESSGALAISADGELVVGWGSSASGLEAARWRRSSTAEPLGDLPGGAFHSGAALVSRDKATIVGTGTIGSGQEIAVWADGRVRGLGDLPEGELASEPFAMSPKGDVIVGRGTSAGCMEAVRWTASKGVEGLGDLPGGTCESVALAVSSDGEVIVGYANSAAGQEAFYWTRAGGMRSLRSLLVAGGLRGTEGWQLRVANGVSGDGRVIVGGGVNPAGASEGWVVRLDSRL